MQTLRGLMFFPAAIISPAVTPSVHKSMTDSQVQKCNDAVKPKYPVQINMFRAIGERLLAKIMTEAKLANTI